MLKARELVGQLADATHHLDGLKHIDHIVQTAARHVQAGGHVVEQQHARFAAGAQAPILALEALAEQGQLRLWRRSRRRGPATGWGCEGGTLAARRSGCKVGGGGGG